MPVLLHHHPVNLRFPGIIMLLVSGTFLSAQSDFDVVFTRYGIEQGLQSLTVDILGQDSTGYIWFSNPLTRFDGYAFKTYLKDPDHPSSGFISATNITDDGKGNLFFASKDGVYFYDPALEYVVQIPGIPLNSSSRKILVGEAGAFWDVNLDYITRIRMPGFDTTQYSIGKLSEGGRLNTVLGQKGVWRSEEKGLTRFDPETREVTHFELSGESSPETSRFTSDGDGHLWVYTDHALWQLDQKKDEFVRIVDLQEIKSRYALSASRDIFVCSKQCWWILARREDVIYRFDLKKRACLAFPVPVDLAVDGQVLRHAPTLEMPDGSLMLGTIGGGLVLINPLTGTVSQYKSDARNPKSLLTNDIRRVLITGSNVCWISGIGQGLIKAEMVKPRFQTYVPEGTSTNWSYDVNVRAFQEWNNGIIVGSIGAVNLFTANKQFIPLPMPGNRKRFSEDGIAAVAKDQYDNLLLLYWTPVVSQSLYYLDYLNSRILNLSEFFPQLTFETSHCILFDSEENFWISANQGVIRIPASVLMSGEFNGRLEQYESIEFDGFPGTGVASHSTYAIAEDQQKNIWIGTNTGVFRLDGETKKLTLFASKPGDHRCLSHNDVRAILVTHDDRIWVGTAGGGLNLFNPDDLSFRHFSIADGLSDNVIYSLLEDKAGKLWLGTNKGLCRFDPVDFQVRNFTPADGIQSWEFNTNAALRTSNGYLVFGGIDGFNFFDPDSIFVKSSPPRVVISSFRIREKAHPFGQDAIRLEHDENFLSFEFSALDYYRNEKNQYAYQLTGVDTGWVYAGDRRYASYPALKPGSYTFQVKAANSDGVWNNAGVSKHITITPPWWDKWWFRLLIFLVLSTGVYTFYRYRWRQALKLQTLRNRIAADLHDEIGSTLSSISLAGTVIQHKLREHNPEVEDLLSKINHNTDDMMEAMSDIVWAVNTKNDKFDQVVYRMRAFAVEILEPKNVQIHFDINPQVMELQLDMQQRKNLYLVFKEAVHNAAKYAQCHNMWVQVEYVHKKLAMKIRDDGVGFDLRDEQNTNLNGSMMNNSKGRLGGNGVQNMQQRAGELKGKLEIDSSKGKGTVVTLSFPVT